MDNPARGITLIVFAALFFSLSDAMAKYLSAWLPAVEIAWIRYIVFVIYAWLLLRRSGGRVRVRNPLLQVARGLMLVGSAVTFMVSIRTLPLAEAATIGFGSPLLITILSVPFLGEVVGLRRWIAVTVGLLGVMVVVRPGTAAFQPAALFTIASSACWAVAIILTRKMSGADAAATLLWSAGSGLAVLSTLLGFEFVLPTAAQIVFCLILGVVASTGQYLMVLAYRHASASLLAPFTYVQLLWATMAGWMFFGAWPDRWTLVGAVIIVGSGVYAAQAERRSRRVSLARA